MNINEFIKPELLVLIPVLYIVGAGLKKSELKDKYIPFTLGCAGVTLALMWVVSTSAILDFGSLCAGLFVAFTQGILCASASVYANQIIKQSGKE